MNRLVSLLIAAVLFAPSDSLSANEENSAIRKINFEKFLIQRDHLDTSLDCPGEHPIKRIEVHYGKLLPGSDEQAVVEATTCMMGNGGADIVEVFQLDTRGKPNSLRIDESPYKRDDLYEGQSWTPRLEIIDGKLTRWFIMYAKGSQNNLKAGTRREISYKWASGGFIIDRVKDTLPEKDIQ